MKSLNLNFGERFRKLREKEALQSPEERKKNYVYILILILLLLLVLYTMRNFVEVNSLNSGAPLHSEPSAADNNTINAARELNAKYEAYLKLREESPQLAALAEAVGRSPVASVVPPPSLASDTSVPEFVPTVTIKALVVLGSDKICTLDIDGEESGKIFKPGATFGGGKGKILSIDAKGVDWTWANKKYRTSL